jgi:hypothetical protein
MSRKQDDLFSSTDLALTTHTLTTDLAPSERSHQLVKAERQIVGEAHKQRLVIQEQERKLATADWAYNQMRVTGVQAFRDCAERTRAVQTAPGLDPETQRYVDQFADRSIRDCGVDIHTATNISAARIHDVVSRDLYRETELERRGILERLFGE